MPNFAAVLWDLDGTIVDTEPLWMASETKLADSYGRTWTNADALMLVGSDLLDAGATLKRVLQLPLSPRQIVDFLVADVTRGLRENVDWRPGARELIAELSDEGVPQALVTMSYAEIAEPIAAQLPFEAVVTGDIVPRGKPHPDPYLLAAQKLGLAATDCLAIEDSPTGAASANAAGCRVVAVPHLVDVPEADNRVCVPSLQNLTLLDLRALPF